MRPLDRHETLALRAALLPRHDALTAWSQLLDEVPWMEFTAPVERCLPAIAVNLGCHSRVEHDDSDDIPYSAKVAGVYRATWAANIMRLRALAPVFDALDARHVDFRVLKGTALCALTDRWGTRRMGDIDILVSAEHGAAAVAELRVLDFAPKFFRTIDDENPPPDSSWIGLHGYIIDLHVANRRLRRTNVLDVLLADPPARITSQGGTWPLPPPENLVVHAAMHARKGSAVSDHIQALIDIASLIPLTSESKLTSLARQVRVTHPLSQLLGEISRVTNTDVPVVVPSRREPSLVGARRVSSRVTSLKRIRQERFSKTLDIRDSNVRKILYRLWIRNGQIRPIERAICLGLGGFLRNGVCDLPRDRRWHFEVPRSLRGRQVRLVIESGDPLERVVFINGIEYGSVAKRASVHLKSAPRTIEVSLRLFGDPPPFHHGPINIAIHGDTNRWTPS